MASSSTSLVRFQRACVTCVRGGRRFFGRYHDFLLDPGTIFTLVSMLLLMLAIIVTPDGVINSAHAKVTLSRGDRKSRSQQFLERPEMIRNRYPKISYAYRFNSD